MLSQNHMWLWRKAVYRQKDLLCTAKELSSQKPQIYAVDSNTVITHVVTCARTLQRTQGAGIT
jgi:hypothetical protein